MTEATSHASRSELIPAAAARYDVEAKEDPREFVFLVLANFTHLAFSAALEPLRIANQLSQKPLYRWSIVSEDGGPVLSSSGVSVNVDGPLEKPDSATTLLVCSGTVTRSHETNYTRAIIREHQRHGGTIGSICTGAFSLARAGILEGRRVTLHWENQPAFDEKFSKIEVSKDIFVIDGKLMTCSGGSAATEMLLWLIEEDYGAEFSAAIAEMCLIGTRRNAKSSQRSSVSYQIGSRNPRLIAAVTLMMENIEVPLSLDEIANSVNGSRRQLERLFTEKLGMSPSRYYKKLRIEQGHSLLRETDLSLMEIALACGFNSTDVFSRSYRERFGQTPGSVKKTNAEP